MVSIMRRLDVMESQTIGYQPRMACHGEETETPMPISGIVGEMPWVPPLTATPVDVYPGGGGIPWYGPGVYRSMAPPLLDPRALKDVQVGDVVPTWDGDAVKAQAWVCSYAR